MREMLTLKGCRTMPVEKKKSDIEIKNIPEEAKNDLGTSSRRFAGSATRAAVSLASTTEPGGWADGSHWSR